MIFRMREYASPAEAEEEMVRFGIDLKPDWLTLRSKVFIYAEGTPPDGMTKLLEDIDQMGGKVFAAESKQGRRFLLLMDYDILPELAAGEDPLAADMLATARRQSSPIIPGLRAGHLSFSRTAVMGILNVTPDSFSDGGLYLARDEAVRRGQEMVDEGADIIDVGGESTRPFSDPVDASVEIERAIPVIRELSQILDVPISIDTRKPKVARAAVDAGASIINDVSGLRDPAMLSLVSELDLPVVIMHMLGEPKTMQLEIGYDDVVGDILLYLRDRIDAAVEEGLREENIIIDPGIGFGKTVTNNLEIIRRLREFRCLGRPLLIGTSRKNFIGKLLGNGRLEGSLATLAVGVMNGASMVRVHDVGQSVKVCRMVDGLLVGHG